MQYLYVLLLTEIIEVGKYQIQIELTVSAKY